MLRYIFSSIIVLVGIYFLFISLPLMGPEKLAAFYQKTNSNGKGILRWEDQRDHPLPQDFADMLGWEEMTQKAASAYHSLDSSEKVNTIIFCDNYGMAGALNYYKNKYQLPEVYSDNASFLYWIPDTIHYQNIVLLTDDQDEMNHAFMKEFSEVKLIGSVTNPYARENGSLIILMKEPVISSANSSSIR
jgi:hypothetical protein